MSSLSNNAAEATDFLKQIVKDDLLDIKTRRNAGWALSELGGSRDEELLRKLDMYFYDEWIKDELHRLMRKDE